jgi:hypothetical protein
MSLHNIINNLELMNILNTNDRSQLYLSVKLISNYIKGMLLLGLSHTIYNNIIFTIFMHKNILNFIRFFN